MPPRNETNGVSLPRAHSSSVGSSVFPTDSVQDVAELLGLPSLKDNVASALAADVEYRIRQVLQDASKFMRHAHRSQLRVADVDRALRQRNIEPIYGFHPTTLGKASASGAYPTPVGSTFRRIQTQSGPIHMIADEEIDLEKILDDSPRVALGPGVGWSAHWLAIEGVQPAVPQNPTSVAQVGATAAPPAAAATSAGASMVQPGGASAFLMPTSTCLSGKVGQPVAKPLIKHVLSRELQLYFERLTTAIIEPPSDANIAENDAKYNSAAAVAQSASTNLDTPTKAADVDGDVSMHASPKSSGTAMASLDNTARDLPSSSGNAVRDAALASLRGDPSLHQLVPYLIQWINGKVQLSLHDINVLELMLHTVDALLSNPHLGIEPYLHQLLPCILTVLLTASLGQAPSSARSYDLRSHAAAILEHIIRQYSAKYAYLKPRILQTIVAALDAGCAKATRRAGGSTVGEQTDPVSLEEASSQAKETEASAKGPRESATTKLGAIIGLRTLGSGSLRILLVQDSPTDGAQDSLLRRLGFWCAEVQQVPQRDVDVLPIIGEVRAAFADVISSLRGDAASRHPPDALRSDEVRRRLGDFWIEVLAEDAEASRGILLLLAELQKP